VASSMSLLMDVQLPRKFGECCTFLAEKSLSILLIHTHPWSGFELMRYLFHWHWKAFRHDWVLGFYGIARNALSTCLISMAIDSWRSELFVFGEKWGRRGTTFFVSGCKRVYGLARSGFHFGSGFGRRIMRSYGKYSALRGS
jgi:hypothetical protein